MAATNRQSVAASGRLSTQPDAFGDKVEEVK